MDKFLINISLYQGKESKVLSNRNPRGITDEPPRRECSPKTAGMSDILAVFFIVFIIRKNSKFSISNSLKVLSDFSTSPDTPAVFLCFAPQFLWARFGQNFC